MHDPFYRCILLLTVAVFSAWNLYRGLATGRTWVKAIFRIERQKSPWNYWIAIAFWAVFTAGFSAAFIAELFGVGLVSARSLGLKDLCVLCDLCG